MTHFRHVEIDMNFIIGVSLKGKVQHWQNYFSDIICCLLNHLTNIFFPVEGKHYLNSEVTSTKTKHFLFNIFIIYLFVLRE